MEVLSTSSPLTLHTRRLPSSSSSPVTSFAASSLSSFSSSYLGISLSNNRNHRLSTTPTNSRRLPRKKRNKLTPISAVFERFTERAIRAIIFSQKEAKSLGKDMVYPQHLLLGLIAEDRDPQGFLGSGVTVDKAREAVSSIWDKANSDDSGLSESSSSSYSRSTDMPFSISTKRVFEAAVEYSRTLECQYIAPEHIAVGLFTVDDGSAGKVLKRLGANMNLLTAAALTRLKGEIAKDGREPPSSKDASPNGRVGGPGRTKEKSVLEQFCVDLTARASEGLIDPVIGREKEVQRVIQILCRRTKNNPILLGEAGVGKTAIAEGLAISIAEANAPGFLLTKRIMSLDIGLLMAGAKERGELESRVTALISEVKKSGKVILFIDEVHTLIGSGTVGRGNKGSGLDIANLLKPPLGRGELQCIASTTLDEFRSQFEKDKALARRFQPVLIDEPSEEDAVKILIGLREKYEAHHNCKYTMEAIDAAVYLSSRYIADRFLPDKAIDLIDEAGSRARIQAFRKKKEDAICILSKPPDDYWQEIRTVQAMHEVVLSSRPNQEDGNAIADESNELVEESSLPPASGNDEPIEVGPDDIAAVASAWSGIPVQQITADERMLLMGLEDQLRNRVVGQDEAVAAISRAVKRSRVGLKDPDRPIAAMLFCGPTGVGKTELTKALAANYFGSEESMLRLDMSEYMERHTVSKLIGSPPGYVGFEEGGMLTEAIRRRPFTVVLFDEIEKAHPDIFNILLQLFEDGHLTDSQGRRVSFKNALIIMTSNVGSSAIAKGRQRSIGFILDDDEEEASYSGMKALVVEELKNYFRPELLNRIDEIVIFRQLEQAQMMEILNLMLQDLKSRLVALGVGLEVSEPVKELICRQGYDPAYGAVSFPSLSAPLSAPLSETLSSQSQTTMGKKKFIDKKKAATFELCPRDTSDPLYSDAPGGDKIFLRVDQNPVNINGFAEDNSQFDDAPEEGEEDLAYGYSSFAGSSSNNPLPADVRKEILELGYPDDGYNYLDHLREIKNTGGGSNFYANPKFEGEYLPRDVKAYDASRVKVSGVVVDGDGGEDDKLMYSVASKTVNVKVKKAIDPEVAALLEDSDGSEFGSDVEDLEEDFVVRANLAEEGEGCSGVSHKEEKVVEFARPPVAAENNSRVPRQIDELFDQLELNEYGSESDYDGEEEEDFKAQSVGDLIYEKPKDYELDEKYMNPADLLKNSDSAKDKEELEYIIRRSVQYGENLVNSNEDELVEVVEESSDESEKWDCETIVTTYSNLDNHPGLICDPERARKKLSEALAKAKSLNGGSRIITLQGKEKLPVEFLPGRRAEQTSVKPKAEPVKRKTHGQETKEEKKERKAAVKTEKREARKMKKETKELYRFETQRAQKAVAVSGPSSIPL